MINNYTHEIVEIESELKSSIPGAGTELPELEDAMNAGEDWDRRGNDEENIKRNVKNYFIIITK